MRLDKYLKVSRLVKRRSVANELATQGRIQLNGRAAKPGTQVEPGDELLIRFGEHLSKIRIKSVQEHVRKEDAADMYEILEV